MKRYSLVVITVVGAQLNTLLSQVDEGDQEIINIRETSSLGPLLYGLIGLGILTLVATVLFWWFTRPPKLALTPPPIPGGTDG